MEIPKEAIINFVKAMIAGGGIWLVIYALMKLQKNEADNKKQ